jgi:hypothetical protein
VSPVEGFRQVAVVNAPENLHRNARWRSPEWLITVLSSVGAGSDHIDHVITQLPYALLIALLTAGLYLWI